MFACLQASNFKAGAKKIFLGLTTIQFLGYQLSDGQLQPDPDKVVSRQGGDLLETHHEANIY